MIANAPDALILPFSEYATFPLPRQNSRAKSFHFIGSNHFRKVCFPWQGRLEISALAG